MKINKQKIIEILITALFSALLAFIQSLMTQNIGIPTDGNTPIVAGVIGAGIRACRA